MNATSSPLPSLRPEVQLKSAPPPKRRTPGILARTAILSWLVTIVTLTIFIAAVLPAQKRAFQQNLDSKARGVAASLRDIAAGAAVSEDFSTVVDHCLKVLTDDPSIEYVVFARKKDGFSIIQERASWRNETLGGDWLPSFTTAQGAIRKMTPLPQEVYLHSSPFMYSGIDWGWVHVGLGLQAYHQNLSALYKLTVLSGVGCTLFALIVSILYARQLTRPIVELREVAQSLAGGELGVRATARSHDEVGELAASFNLMAEAVQSRDERLRRQRNTLARLVTDKTLRSGATEAACRLVTESSRSTLGVARCNVWLLTPDETELVAVDICSGEPPQHARGPAFPTRLLPRYLETLRSHRVLAVNDLARNDSLAELNDLHLRPVRTTALLQAAIRRATATVGVVAFEQSDTPREWTTEEQNFAASVADLVALALEARDREEAEVALNHHNRLLQSVRFVAEHLLAATDWLAAIEAVVAHLGRSASACRVRYFALHRSPEGLEQILERARWIPEELISQMPTGVPDPPVWQVPGWAGWSIELAAGKPVFVSPDKSTDAQCSLPTPVLARSMLLIPVFASKNWCGFLELDDCRGGRQWNSAEIGTLQAAADSLGAAISRDDAKRALIAAKDAAESASRAKSQFLANMSHEIRTPITGVLGMLRLLQGTTLDTRQSRYVANSLTAAESLLDVIGDVLDFSKIEAGHLRIESRPFELADVLETALRILAEKAEAKGIELASRVDANVPRQLLGDPDRLRQVLLNLLSNAVKFTDRGEIVVSCSRVNGDSVSSQLRFEVRDTGCGIQPEHQGVIFDAFCQADSSMSRTHGGTGLGLTICRQLVHFMGGEIGVDSTPGVGSTFWFTVQLSHGPVSPESGPVDLAGLRVLVVDDSAIVRDIVSSYIQAWKGYPEVAADAVTALDRLREGNATGRPFAVAIVDWRMPKMDGLGLIRTIRADSALRSTGIVLLSSFTKADLPDVPASIGVAAFVSKPVRKSELYDAIVIAANGHLTSPSTPVHRQRKNAQRTEAYRGTGTILLAEDNDINQEVASEMLSSLGYHCIRVRTGRGALEAAQGGGIDLILMDCQMPEMDGYEATRRIRRWERSTDGSQSHSSHLPIVALTAHAMADDRQRCIEAGMDDYLTKPLDPEALGPMLLRWITPRPAGPAAVTQSSAASSGENGSRSPSTASLMKTENERTKSWPIDRASLLQRCMGKEDLMRRLIVKFVDQGGRDLDELRACIDRQDPAAMSAVAHRIKGAAANVSVEGIRGPAAELERLGRTGSVEGAADWLQKMQACLEAVRQASP